MYFSGYPKFHDSFFEQLRDGRKDLPLLPNLRAMECPIDLTILHLFASPSVTQWGLHLTDKIEVVTTALSSFISSLPQAMPRISYLYINIILSAEFNPDDFNDFQATIPSALAEMKQLKEVLLPPSWLTPRITKALASLPDLAIITTIEMWDLVDESAILPSPSDLLESSDFPSLNQLSIVTNLDRILSWFQRCSSSRSMAHLSILSPEPESKATFTRTIDYVSENMSSNLEELSLEAGGLLYPPTDLSTIRLTDLKPLFVCQELESLDLSFAFPFDINVEDIISIVESLPSLTTLKLNPSPSHTDDHEPSLHLSCLSTLARSSACQSLQHLGLYVDTSSDQLPSDDEDISLHNVTNLDLGYSSLSPSSIEAVAEYIGGIIPKRCFLSAAKSEEWRAVLLLLEAWGGRPQYFAEEDSE
ncbi:hypothetical protein ONZ45_g15230 [Pleurotus djamor]|nr:hypothetical protein ONZ45_g15230 [Pleurotus djamor]